MLISVPEALLRISGALQGCQDLFPRAGSLADEALPPTVHCPEIEPKCSNGVNLRALLQKV